MFQIDTLSRQPVYEQLTRQVEYFIITGIFKECDQIPSVRSVAVGKDTAGNCRYFDCSIISFAPYKLFPGEVGTFEIGKDTVFYWQLDNDSVLCARFFGFDNDDAMKLFKGMIQDMKK